MSFRRRHKSRTWGLKAGRESGIILVIVLWILVILSLLTAGLSRRAEVNLALTKFALDQSRARHVLWGGVEYALAVMAGDDQDEDSRDFDTVYQCGFSLKPDQSPEDLFSGIRVGKEGMFDIQGVFRENEDDFWVYGFADEESKINLNALSANDDQILVQLIQQLGYSEETARQVTASVIDWKDSDGDIFDEPYGAEEDYYAALEPPVQVKNRPFENVEELLMVRGVSAELFRSLRPFVTVYPLTGGLRINLDTASDEVLLAAATRFTGAQTNTSPADAVSLVEKMILYRRGPDEIPGTQDDRMMDIQKIPLTSKEKVLALMMNPLRTKKSNFLRADIRARASETSSPYRVEVIFDRKQKKIVSWRR